MAKSPWSTPSSVTPLSTGAIGLLSVSGTAANSNQLGGVGSSSYATQAWVTTTFSGLVGAMVFQGAWNASTNSPALASGVGTKGFFYKVSTSGSTLIDGCSSWNAGDMIAFDGTVWDKIDGITSEVISVFGRTGAVVLLSADVTGALGFTPPSTTGTGASGSWAIAITGNAATATSLAAGALDSVPYQSAAATTAYLAGNTTTTPKFLCSTGTGSAAQAPTFVGSYGSGNVALETDATWSPTVVGLTIVGTPTYTAKYKQIGNVVFWSIRIQSTTSTASTSGTTTFSLPVPAINPTSFLAINDVSLVAVGQGFISGSVAYPPTWGASADITISGFYFAT